MKKPAILFCRFRGTWAEVSGTLGTFHRRRELKQLIRWAQRKGLDGPICAYQTRLDDEETRLIRYKMRSPRLVKWAYTLVLIHWMIIPEPKYYPKGYAAKFRRIA